MLDTQPPIGILPPHLAQRIAAGEVVERPASVVRELVENALDAGAGAISIEIRGGGLELIQVADDGHGIPADQLTLAFARHGTSKVVTSDDLEAITTLGFRGEALPSIAAVAAVDLASATEEAPHGARITLRDGEVLDVEPTARTRGTTARVRELFAALPVRRGFLPPSRSETALIGLLVRRYALARPQVRFSLRIEGRDTFRSAGLGEAGALAAVYGQSAARLAAFQAPDMSDLRIWGHLGDPGLTRPDRDGITFVVNGRWVTPARWLSALEDAYRPLLRRGRHPVAVVRVRIDPHLLDVNLHPAKLEIRMRGEDEILRVLGVTLRATLGQIPAHAHLVDTPGLATVPRQRTLPAPRRMLAEEQQGYGDETPDYARLRILGQLMQTMILADDGIALYLIDQHRADERAIYEKLSAADGRQGAQELLQPLSVEVRPDQEAALEVALPELTRLGFRCERFGRRTFLIRAVPLGLPDDAGAALAGALGAASLLGPDWREGLLAQVACHTAVRRGVALGEDSMRRLILALGASEVRTMCPHGSPIVARVRREELARHFDWRG